MEQTLEFRTNEAWGNASASWNHPSLPHVIAPRTKEEIQQLGEIGHHLQRELAFMKYPEFQTYANLENIAQAFGEDSQRGLNAVLKHEQGHRFCPYDTITTILLRHAVKRGLEGTVVPYNADAAADLILNLFTDMSINTALARKGDKDIVWAYQQVSKDKKESKLWRVYGKSMERAWNTQLLPEGTNIKKDESDAANELAALFERDVLDRSTWRDKTKAYAKVISKFLEDEKKDKSATFDDVSSNTPQQLDEKTAGELAKRLAEIGSDGLPTNPSGLKEFKEIMAGFGRGDPVEASICFYEMLSRAYDVMFATKPFGRQRTSPFQPEKWQPSMGADLLDVGYSVQLGGRLIPGMTTYMWNTRKREISGGVEEVIPNIDIEIDSSSSMPNPVNEISLPVLAGFVAAKKAHRKGAKIRVTNFSGKGQSETQDWTRDLYAAYRKLVVYYGGGTVFPAEQLLGGGDPKLALVITDTFLANKEETATAVAELLRRNTGNKVSIYALHPVADAEYLRSAGAEVIHGTTTDIFKRVIGKAHEVYAR